MPSGQLQQSAPNYCSINVNGKKLQKQRRLCKSRRSYESKNCSNAGNGDTDMLSNQGTLVQTSSEMMMMIRQVYGRWWWWLTPANGHEYDGDDLYIMVRCVCVCHEKVTNFFRNFLRWENHFLRWENHFWDGKTIFWDGKTIFEMGKKKFELG